MNQPTLALGAARGTFLTYGSGPHRSRADHAIFALHHTQPPEWMWHTGARGVFDCLADHIEQGEGVSHLTAGMVRDRV
eukprot:2303388-Rhodomonas_salina.1